MDLKFTDAAADEHERSAVDSVLGAPDSSWFGSEGPSARSGGDLRRAEGGLARQRRDQLLPVLHAIQSRVGWISPGALNYASLRLGVPPAESYGVASFYGLFSTTRREPITVHVCDDIACLSRGGKALCRALETDASAGSNPFVVIPSPCLGLCERAPAALVSRASEQPAERVVAPANESAVRAAITQLADSGGHPSAPDRFDVAASAPQCAAADGRGLRLLARVGRVDPTSLDAYLGSGGYVALERAFELGAQGVIDEVLASKLLGRGGAAFPAGRKWQGARAMFEKGRTPLLVCNADESEPGTFKDRVLIEADPFALIEAMTIAGFAIGSDRGYLYLRGEYPLALERAEHAITEARAQGYLGARVAGRDYAFDIELRRGAGAYICGEETALFNSIEGFRGEPRSKPPFPTEVGLFDRPTVVNNVETLANVPWILREGGEAFARLGTAGSSGSKLFCVSGAVARPGVYEATFGLTLRELLALAGGVAGTGRLRAVLMGGAAGGFLSHDELDTPLTFEGLRAAKSALGSGVVMVFDDAVDLREILARIARFFRDESCGQCVPCRVGTVRQEELLARLARDRPLGSVDQELALLAELGQAMRDASICGLGHTASSAVESALARWRIFS